MKKLLLIVGAILSVLYTAGSLWGVVVSIRGGDPRAPSGPGGVAAMIAVACMAGAVFAMCIRALRQKPPVE